MILIQVLDADNRVLLDRKVDNFPCTVGRSPLNDIVVPDRSVSGMHVLIEFDGIDIVLRDNGSSNGIYKGSKRVNEIRGGESVSCGVGKLRLVASKLEASVEKTQMLTLAQLSERSERNKKVNNKVPPRDETVAIEEFALSTRILFFTLALFLLAGEIFLKGLIDPKDIAIAVIESLVTILLVAGAVSILSRLISKAWRFWDFLALGATTYCYDSVLNLARQTVDFNWTTKLANQATSAAGLLSFVLYFLVCRAVFARFSWAKFGIGFAVVALSLAGYGFLKEGRGRAEPEFTVKTWHKLDDTLVRVLRPLRSDTDSTTHLTELMNDDFDALEASRDPASN